MPSFWLPPHVRGNGLDADRWAELVQVTEPDVPSLLEAFRVAGVPARADVVATVPGRRRWIRVFVAPDHYAQAENVLMHYRAGGGPAGSNS